MWISLALNTKERIGGRGLPRSHRYRRLQGKLRETFFQIVGISLPSGKLHSPGLMRFLSHRESQCVGSAFGFFFAALDAEVAVISPAAARISSSAADPRVAVGLSSGASVPAHFVDIIEMLRKIFWLCNFACVMCAHCTDCTVYL